MRHREVDRARADPFGPCLQASRKRDAGLRPARDLDLAPREGARDAEAQRLADRLLAGEPSGVVLRRIRPGVAVSALRLGEAALPKRRVPLERPAHPRDFNQVYAYCHNADSRNAGTSPIESRTASGWALQAPASSRNLPVRTRIVCIPSTPAPPMSVSTSSPTIQAFSGSASSTSSAASKYEALGFPSTVAGAPVAYSSPTTKAPASRSAPRDVCHHGFLCRQ